MTGHLGMSYIDQTDDDDGDGNADDEEYLPLFGRLATSLFGEQTLLGSI